MNSPFLNRDSAATFLLPENTNPNGKHMDFRDPQGNTFAKMEKVFKEGWFLGLFSVFRSAAPVYGELKDAGGTLLLTTTSYWGATARESKVEIYDPPGGTLIGTLYDAPFGADFEGPTGALLGRARRPEDLKSEPRDVLYTYTDAAAQVVGTCDRRHPQRSSSTLDQSMELLDFLYYGTTMLGQPVQLVTLTAPVDPTLHLFLHLFPALQHLRYTRP